MSGIAHFIHFVLTVLTGGFWLPLWILFALITNSGNRKRAERARNEELELLRELVHNTKERK
jgi:hypothetical protein